MPDPAFSNKSVAFLRKLKRNNDRAWFHGHRDEYERHLRAPVLAIVDRLAADFRAFAPELVADPKVSLFRPWRDTRFSEDKAPLKTNIAAVFPNRTLGRMNGAGLYFEVATTWVWIGGGIYAPDSGQLHAIREHIAANQARFEALLEAPAFKRLGGLKGDTLTRVPRGWARDHPAARYLVHKQFLGFREEPAAFAARPDFYQQLLGTMRALAPLVSFLNEPLVANLQIDRRAHILHE
ncbi:MAG: DUF2461 domain-containing protein [Vicinamibacterales bacterium]